MNTRNVGLFVLVLCLLFSLFIGLWANDTVTAQEPEPTPTDEVQPAPPRTIPPVLVSPLAPPMYKSYLPMVMK